MNRRHSAVIACAIGVPTALVLLSASVPWMQTSARQWSVIGLQEAADRRPLPLPRTRPFPSVLKQKRITSQSTVLAKTSTRAGPALLPIVDQQDIRPHHRLIAQRVLMTLPPHCRTNLQHFFVLYENARQRGLGGKTTIILDGSVSDEEFLSLLVHECGHVTHGNLTGTRASGNSAFLDGRDRFFVDSPAAAFFAISWENENVLHERALSQDFVSGYAKTDAFEDFSESFAAYVLHRELLRERAKTNAAIAAKLAWMEAYVPLQENALATSTYVMDAAIPWDITKLSIEY